jgi:hypothetical protein
MPGRADNPLRTGACAVLRRAAAPAIALAAILLSAPHVGAQAIPTKGRFALFTSWSQREWLDSASSDFTEVVAMLSFHSKETPGDTFEFALDARFATYPSSNRDQRVSLYEGFVGIHSKNRSWNVRLGQMWLHELGGIGSVGGLFAEYRQPRPTSWGRWRFALFGGLELAPYDLEYLTDIKKGGAYVALDGSHGRQHVLGYVNIRNQDLTERSVVTFNNFIPVGRAFTLYQALEYDTEGPAGLGDPELSYFFANLRYRFSRAVDLQGTYHRGRSIDARHITEDVIGGRPISPEALQGLLYESGRLRLTVRPVRNISIWATYGNDRNNRGDSTATRFNLGLSARRLLGTPADFTISSAQTKRGDDSYDSLWASLGYSFGPKVYVSLEYRDTLSVFHLDRGEDGSVEIRPNSKLFSLSSNINLNRTFSLLITLEHLDHSDFDEQRILTGLIVRF